MKKIKLIKVSGIILTLLFTFFLAPQSNSNINYTFPSSNITIEWWAVASWEMTIISAYELWAIPNTYHNLIQWDVFLNGNKIYESTWEKLLFYPEVQWEYIVILFNNNIEVNTKIITVEQGPSSDLWFNIKEVFISDSGPVDITWVPYTQNTHTWIFIKNNNIWELRPWDDIQLDVYVKTNDKFSNIDTKITYSENFDYVDSNISDSFIDVWTQTWAKDPNANIISIIWDINADNQWDYTRSWEKLIKLNFKANKWWTWKISILSNSIQKQWTYPSWETYNEQVNLLSSYINYNILYSILDIFSSSHSNYKTNILISIAKMQNKFEKAKYLNRFLYNENISSIEKLNSFYHALEIGDINTENKQFIMDTIINITEYWNLDIWDVNIDKATKTARKLSLVKDNESLKKISSSKIYPIVYEIDNSLLSQLWLLDKKAVDITSLEWSIVTDKAILFPTWTAIKEVIIENSKDFWGNIAKIIIPFWTVIKKQSNSSITTWQNAIIDPITSLETPSEVSNLNETSSWNFEIKKLFKFWWANNQHINFENGSITILIPKWDINESDLTSLKLKHFNYDNSQWINNTDVVFSINPSNPTYLTISNITHATEFALWIDNIWPEANIQTNTLSWSAPLSVTFDASQSNDPDWTISEYIWDFWNSNIWNWIQVTNVFSSMWTHKVTLTVKDNHWIEDSNFILINVQNQNPIANYTQSKDNGTSPLVVVFDAETSYDPDWSIVYYEWDFWDSIKWNWKTITHTFENDWTYDVVLKVTDNNWSQETKTTQIITLNEAPIAKIKVDKTQWVAPLAVKFDANLSYDPDWTISTYEWLFWNWKNWYWKQISHIYTTTWDFNVKLKVKDNKGKYWEIYYTITVNPNRKENQMPIAAFTTSATSWKAPLPVSFNWSASKDADWHITAYKWYFWDWTTWEWANTTHTYKKHWNFTVRLEVIDDIWWVWYSDKAIKISNSKPVANFTMNWNWENYSFDASSSTDKDWSIDKYKWDFWDKWSWEWKITKHSFEKEKEYTVKLTVTNNAGLTWSITKQINTITKKEAPKVEKAAPKVSSSSSAPSSSKSSVKNKNPIAFFKSSVTTWSPPLKIVFDAGLSRDDWGKIVSYNWNFWDRGLGKWMKVEHTFLKPWKYEVWLVIIDNNWWIWKKNITINVVNKNPIADFTVSKTGWIAPAEIIFDALKSKDSDWTIASYEWDFWDWSKWKWIKTTHLFKSEWDFKVKLKIIDNAGWIWNKEINIKLSNSVPVASFTATPKSWSSPLSVSFDAKASTDKNWGIAKYEWDFWDWNTWTWKTIKHNFEKEWNYAVSLKTINKTWNSDIAIRWIEVINKLPTAWFSASAKKDNNLEISFDAAGSKDDDWNIVSYEWDFWDWNTWNNKNSNNSFSKSWNYIVTLTIKDNNWWTNLIAYKVNIGSEKPILTKLTSDVADINLDKKITIDDFFLFLRKFWEKDYNSNIDLNKNDKKDDIDIQIFLHQYNLGK